MSEAQKIDGKAFAEGLCGRVAAKVAKLKDQHDITPGLAVVLVGEDPASQVYVRNKGEQTKAAGMNSFEFRLDADALDATDNASNSAIEPFGLTARQIWDIIRKLRKSNLWGQSRLVGSASLFGSLEWQHFQDQAGEVYALTSITTGPVGSLDTIYKIVPAE